MTNWEIEEFLEWFKEQCREVRGRVNEDVTKEVLECTFDSPEYVEVKVKRKFGSNKWTLRMCIGYPDVGCKEIDLPKVLIDLHPETRLLKSLGAGFKVNFIGEPELHYLFGKEEIYDGEDAGLNGIQIRNRRESLEIYFIQKK